MTLKQHGRQYDLVVFGATGYTGRFTAEIITRSLPTNLKWAVAGRSKSKLQELVDHCAKINSDRLPANVETADTSDLTQIRELVRKTYIVITTVGPYAQYGEPMFRACAEEGTHYLDVTGEWPWVYRMINKYEKAAQSSGAMMFPEIGIESSPPDLCTLLMTKQIRQTMDAPTKDVTMCMWDLRSAPSGGTLASVLGMFDSFSLSEFGSSFAPYAASPVARHAEPKRLPVPLLTKLFGVITVPNLGTLTTSLPSAVDTAVVERSWGFMSKLSSEGNSRYESYGPNFTFREFHKARNWLHGIALHLALAFGSLLVLFSPVRTLVKRFIFAPGQGPDLQVAVKDEIEFRGIANPDTATPSGKQAYCRAWFHGGMYYLSGLFLAQAALTLLEDDLGLQGGVYTPACLGEGFIERLDDGGFKTEVKMIDV